jgi:hypothetical protein
MTMNDVGRDLLFRQMLDTSEIYIEKKELFNRACARAMMSVAEARYCVGSVSWACLENDFANELFISAQKKKKKKKNANASFFVVGEDGDEEGNDDDDESSKNYAKIGVIHERDRDMGDEEEEEKEGEEEYGAESVTQFVALFDGDEDVSENETNNKKVVTFKPIARIRVEKKFRDIIRASAALLNAKNRLEKVVHVYEKKYSLAA